LRKRDGISRISAILETGISHNPRFAMLAPARNLLIFSPPTRMSAFQPDADNRYREEEWAAGQLRPNHDPATIG
jgi:hypothetical protein